MTWTKEILIRLGQDVVQYLDSTSSEIEFHLATNYPNLFIMLASLSPTQRHLKSQQIKLALNETIGEEYVRQYATAYAVCESVSRATRPS